MGYEDLAFERWLEGGRDKKEVDGKVLINADVELDEDAMTQALKDSKEWQMQLDDDTENLSEEWTE